MKNNTKRLIAATTTIAVGAFLSWMGGYNFDHRDPGVAATAVMVLIVAIIASLFPFIDD